jgi:hypothetical protein
MLLEKADDLLHAAGSRVRLALHELFAMHPKLRGHPPDLPKLGALALQRAGHASPVPAEIDHEGAEGVAEVEWLPQDSSLLQVLDGNRITEDGAEAVALAYASSWAGWVVKRRLQRWESADWLLSRAARWLALEVSGTATGDPFARLKEKQQQVARCSLPAERLAIVVAFARPSIAAGKV